MILYLSSSVKSFNIVINTQINTLKIVIPNTLSNCFFIQAKQTPNNIAITDENIELTYQQTANQIINLARYLSENGYNHNSIISIYSSKRYEIIIAFLAVSSIGASCVQLDKSFPLPLLKDIINDTNPDLILCDEIPDIKSVKCINYISIISKCDDSKIQVPTDINIDPEKDFWLVYSSGTTGKNKGISISHRAILESYKIRETIKPYDNSSSIGCNIYYLWEAFRPLLKGGRTNIIPDTVLYDFKALAKYIKNKKINEILFTPSYLETLLSTSEDTAIEIFHDIDTCWLNGEVVSSWLQYKLEKFMSSTNIYNLYSISECHDVAVYKLHPNDKYLEEDGIVPVGHVLPKVDAVVLNENKEIVKNGQKGEVYIHSIGLANEYINRPDLNAERFISAANSPIKKRLYKTGDFGKLSDDGQLITIYGRCDYIIKLRGYTLSLPFIESVIKDKLDIMHCIVDKTGATRMSESLIAYLEIPKENQDTFRQQWNLKDNNKPSKKLLDKIAPHLAHYMLPKYIVLLDEIPLNRYSNKLDRNSIKYDDLIIETQEVQAINNLQEYKRLWSNILNISEDDISLTSCFFELGGSSLSAMLLISNLKEFGFDISISNFVEKSSLQDSYNLVTNNQSSTKQKITQEILDDINKFTTTIKSNICEDLPSTNTGNILLTGTTGFLGSHLLAHLISNDEIQTIYCLVRATDENQARQRVEKTLEKLNVKTNSKIVYLNGDITKTNFGLDSKKWLELSKEINTVIHTAASVNLLLPYNALKPSNLDGTAHCIDFCLTNKSKHLIYISTNGIFPLHLNKIFDESNSIDWIESLESGYSQTKWAAEKLVHKMIEKGLNASVLRLGNLSPQTPSYINKSDTNWLLLKEIITQKKIPQNINLEMTPVDNVTKIVEHLILTKPDYNILNITNKIFLNANILAKCFNYETIEYNNWLDTIIDDSTKFLANDKLNIDSSICNYDRTNYQRIMKEININYPEITAEYINNIFLGGKDELTYK
ncbi:SDR family oxidoreductase [Francisella salimarina]|uniref:SDR family oxidoreductase n=1 Tax=Francisella salimarina TaxID=2599927 RepID=UPI0011B50A9B|nr:SDR family oxidoreductase [Francisella salimarina]